MPTGAYFAGWDGIIRTVIVGVPAYIALVLILRLSGKRSLAQMNAFDLVVTVSLGSTLATMLLSKSVALAEGITALSLLLFLQFIITWLSVRFTSFRKMVERTASRTCAPGVFPAFDRFGAAFGGFRVVKKPPAPGKPAVYDYLQP